MKVYGKKVLVIILRIPTMSKQHHIHDKNPFLLERICLFGMKRYLAYQVCINLSGLILIEVTKSVKRYSSYWLQSRSKRTRVLF